MTAEYYDPTTAQRYQQHFVFRCSDRLQVRQVRTIRLSSYSYALSLSCWDSYPSKSFSHFTNL